VALLEQPGPSQTQKAGGHGGFQQSGWIEQFCSVNSPFWLPNELDATSSCN
jgi:hypothetical protein